jgi:hypothetical protein
MTHELAWIFVIFEAFYKADVRFGGLPLFRAARLDGAGRTDPVLATATGIRYL